MKSILLLSLAMVLWAMSPQSVSAESYAKVIVRCHSVEAGPDYGLTVAIQEAFDSIMTAIVTEDTIAGVRYIGQFEVQLKSRDPRVMGAPTIYFGKNFELIIKVGTTPLPDGIFSHVTLETENREISEDMSCKYL